MRDGRRCTAVLLSAGTGSRMKSDIAKQYLPLAGKPVIWYALNAVERSGVIDDCILVAGAQDLAFVRREIVEKYGFQKVDAVIAGGAQRYDSVANAMEWIAKGGLTTPNEDGLVFVQDGARPFLTEEILERTADAAIRFGACVAAMPSKDTVKLADAEGFAQSTPDRGSVWTVQTPQVFDRRLIVDAYARLRRELAELTAAGATITDDAGVVELLTEGKVKLVEGSYRNIKITTPEDLRIAESFLRESENA